MWACHYVINLWCLLLQMGKVVQLNQELKSRLHQYELLFEQLRLDNLLMREKLLQLGVNVMDLTKTSYNGSCKFLASPSGSPPQRSPTEAPTTPQAALLAGYAAHMLHSSMLQSYAGLAVSAASVGSNDRYVKQERDGTWERSGQIGTLPGGVLGSWCFLWVQMSYVVCQVLACWRFSQCCIIEYCVVLLLCKLVSLLSFWMTHDEISMKVLFSKELVKIMACSDNWSRIILGYTNWKYIRKEESLF